MRRSKNLKAGSWTADEGGVKTATGAVLKTARIKVDGREVLVILPVAIVEGTHSNATGFYQRIQALSPRKN